MDDVMTDERYSVMTDERYSDDFVQHVVKTPSQYDRTCRVLAAEIVQLRAALRTLGKARREYVESVGHVGPMHDPLTGLKAGCPACMALDKERVAMDVVCTIADRIATGGK